MYMKAKGFFKEKWLSVQKSMGGKGSLKNFSANYPLQVLEKADEDLIAGTVVVDKDSQTIFRTTEDLIAWKKKVAAQRAAREPY